MIFQNKMKFYLFLLPFLSQVSASAIIGDSMYWSGWLFWGGQPSFLAQYLEQWAGHAIPNHALVGASLEVGFVKSIEQQFHELSPSDQITTLIMDGGGNDVMSHKNDCLNFNSKCIEMVDNCLNIITDIFEGAPAKNISHILYLGFYYLPGLEKVTDLANTKINALCESTTIVDCHFIDPRYNETTHTGLKTPEMLGSDGIHPTKEGFKILAQMIWEKKLEFNIPV